MKPIGMYIKYFKKKIIAYYEESYYRLTHSLNSKIYRLKIPLEPDNEKGWKPYSIFSGFTSTIESLACHVSVLNKDKIPHPIHDHKEEEVLLLLSGELDLIYREDQYSKVDKRKRLNPGHLIYYPADFFHTIQAISNKPANYVMVKWFNSKKNNDYPIGFQHFSLFDDNENVYAKEGFCPKILFEGPTSCLKKLHCHSSLLKPKADYEPHCDPYDVVIIVLEGQVKTLNNIAKPHDVIFYRKGTPHGMHNPGDNPVKYIVFELHNT